MVDQIVVVGAGYPHRGKDPTLVSKIFSQTSVLDWTLSTVASLSSVRPVVVLGYGIDLVAENYKGQSHFLENEDWANSGPVSSLFQVDFQASTSLVLLYGDCVFRPEALSDLFASDANLSVAYDPDWKTRFPGRTVADMVRAEKLTLANSLVNRVGIDIAVDDADGEFAGALKVQGSALARLKEIQSEWREVTRRNFRDSVPELVKTLLSDGFSARPYSCSGAWAEVRQPEDVARFVLGSKAETLQRLRVVAKNFVIQEQKTVSRGDWARRPEEICREVFDFFGGSPLVVRSSFAEEDSFDSSFAGVFESIIGVDDDLALGKAVETVFESYKSHDVADVVLIQPQVTDVLCAGVCFTRTLDAQAPYYVVNFSADGSTDGVTSGNSVDQVTEVVRREFAESGDFTWPLNVVIPAVREIEKLLSYDSLDIEFAVGGDKIVHIFQVRPLAVTTNTDFLTENEVDVFFQDMKRKWDAETRDHESLFGAPAVFGLMPDWNPAEIIGLSPRALAESLYQYLVTDEVWALQRYEYGNRDLRGHKLMRNLGGKPFVDATASITSFMPEGLDRGLTFRLVGFFVKWLTAHPEHHDKLEFEVVPSTFDLNFRKWAGRLAEEGGFAENEIDQLREGLRSTTAGAIKSLENHLESIRVLVSKQEFTRKRDALDPWNRAQILLSDAKWFGALPFAHTARAGFVAVGLLRSGVASGILSSAALDDFFSTLRSVSHEFTKDVAQASSDSRLEERLIERYGHLRPGTYDVLSPRYDSNPEFFMRSNSPEDSEDDLQESGSEGLVWDSEKKLFLEALVEERLVSSPSEAEKFLRAAIEGREYSKFVFSKSVSNALETLVLVGEEFGLGREDVSYVPLNLFGWAAENRHKPDTVRVVLEESIALNRRNLSLSTKVRVPYILSEARDFDVHRMMPEIPNFVGTASVIGSPNFLSMKNEVFDVDLEDKIIFIESADPGYDWIFSRRILGLVTMFGGSNSHMAIRAAEFRLPAAIGVGSGAFTRLRGAGLVELSPAAQVVRALR